MGGGSISPSLCHSRPFVICSNDLFTLLCPHFPLASHTPVIENDSLFSKPLNHSVLTHTHTHTSAFAQVFPFFFFLSFLSPARCWLKSFSFINQLKGHLYQVAFLQPLLCHKCWIYPFSCRVLTHSGLSCSLNPQNLPGRGSIWAGP